MMMKQNAFKSTTAILMVLSLGQPVAGLAQSVGGGEPANISELPLLMGRDWPDIAPERVQMCMDEGITDAPACVVFLDALEAEARDAAQAQEQADLDAARAAVAEQEAAEAAAIAAQENADKAQAEATAQEAVDIAAEAEAIAAAAAEEAARAKAEAEAEDTAARAAADATATAVLQEQALADAQAAADALAAEEALATIAAFDTATEAAEDVTTEILSADTQRSSNEEFQGQGTQTPDTTASRSSGLSDLERAGLLALGAVAVGAILLNGQRVQSQTGDRVIVVDDAGTYTVLKDDDALLRAPGSEVRTERFTDGSTRTTVIRDDGTRIITVRDINGRALRRVRIEPDGREYLLIDDTRDFQPVIVRDLPPPIRQTIDLQTAPDRDALRLALLAADRTDIGRSFSLRQVREIVEVRSLAPEINLAGITFETNSAAIPPAQAERLREMGLLMRDLIRDNPTELFLVEGHTDAIGDAGYNLLLSDRRAESVALAFSEYFGVNAENMIVQGYGERFLKIPTQSSERLNRRVAVRRITTLVRPY
jgi:outer membrane protein OmpA-like peptidoglycan-associated protein